MIVEDNPASAIEENMEPDPNEIASNKAHIYNNISKHEIHIHKW